MLFLVESSTCCFVAYDKAFVLFGFDYFVYPCTDKHICLIRSQQNTGHWNIQKGDRAAVGSEGFFPGLLPTVPVL